MLIPTLFSLFLFPTLLQMCILKKFGVAIWALAPAPFTLLPKIFWNSDRDVQLRAPWFLKKIWNLKLRTAKNARPQHFFRESWIFSATPPPQHNTTQHTTQHGATFRPLTTQRYGPVITSTAAIFKGKSSDRQRSEGSSYLKAITAQYLWRRGKILWRWPTNLCISHNNTHQR